MVEKRVGREDAVGVESYPGADSIEPPASQILAAGAHPVGKRLGQRAILELRIRVLGKRFLRHCHSTLLEKHGELQALTTQKICFRLVRPLQRRFRLRTVEYGDR